jgi:hypothetical protein
VGETIVEPLTSSSDEELNNEEDNVVLLKMIDGDEKVEEPKPSMTFTSVEEVRTYYRKFAKQAGFGVLTRTTKKVHGEQRYLILTCSRGRLQQTSTSKSSKPIPTTNRTGCRARICASKCDDGTWFLRKVVLEHNHQLSAGKARFFRCNKIINDATKRRLELNDRTGIRLTKNFNSLVVENGGFESLSFGERDCRNFINKARELRLGKGGAQALCDYFSRMQKKNNGFYYVMEMDDDCRLQNVFWADARSQTAYEFFGDVVTFDTTYLTNRYDMPFAPFVGVNHHGQSILLGAGLISSEDTDTFVWLFKSWLECMNGRAPKAIMTDQDRAMKNAIAIVFPETRHRYYLWHIMRKLPEKFGAHANFDGIKSALDTCLYDSQTCEEYETNWKNLLESYDLHDNAWLRGLYSEKTFWVPAYMKDTFWAGMSTTQRSESMNSFFDRYMHSQTTLKEVVDQFDSGLRRMVENEKKGDFDSFNRTIPCLSLSSFEKQFQDVYTNAKFKEVHEQFGRVMHCNNKVLRSEGAISTYEVIEYVVVFGNQIEKTFVVYFNEDELEVKCTCALFELRGILCRHSISVLMTKNVKPLPSRYILDRWRKDIKREYSMLKSSYDDFGDTPNAQIYDKLRQNFERVLSLTLGNVERCMDLMNDVDKLRDKYSALKLAPSPSSHHISVVASYSCNEVDQSNNKVLSPIKVKRKGRPLSTRKVSVIEKVAKKAPTVEQTAKKAQASKKSPSDNNAKQKKRKNQVGTFFSPYTYKHVHCPKYRFLLHFVQNTFKQLFFSFFFF